MSSTDYNKPLINSPLQPEQQIINEGCQLSINTLAPNPFISKDNCPNNTWKTNCLLLQDFRLRTLAGVAPLDRGATSSSKYISPLHQKPCYAPYNIQYYSNKQSVPIAGYPHA